MRIILWDDTCYDKRFVCLSDYNNHLAKYKQEERERGGEKDNITNPEYLWLSKTKKEGKNMGQYCLGLQRGIGSLLLKLDKEQFLEK